MKTAVVVGFDYHVRVFCNKMNAHAVNWRFLAFQSNKLGLLSAFFRMVSADALISFGGPAPHSLLLAMARARGVPVFVIWAGTDVTGALAERYTMSHAKRMESTHLAVAPWLAEELRQVAVDATYLPIIGMQPNPAPSLASNEFIVLTYLPEPRRDFYGKAHVYEVARRLPNVYFSVIGTGGVDRSAPANVRFLGWRTDVSRLIDQSAVLLRVAEHDGMSLVVLEALARGKHVAWNQKIPGVTHVTTVDETTKYLTQLYDLYLAGDLGFNQEGFDFIRAAYEEKTVSLGVERFIDDAVRQKRERQRRCRKVAVLGLDIFSTDVAQLNNSLETGWVAQVLQFDTKYELIGALYSFIRADLWYTVGMPTVGRSIQMLSRFARIPRVMHWVGTDIDAARRNPKILEDLCAPTVRHLTEVGWEAEELSLLGVRAQIAPLPPRFDCLGPVPALPRLFTLLIYLPRSRQEFYGSRELHMLIRLFEGRAIKFLIVGGGTLDSQSSDQVENLGWRYSLTGVYERTSALLRFTPRDGLSLMVLESLAFGRHVLWTKQFPFVYQVGSFEDIVAELDRMITLNEEGKLRPQLDAASFVRSTYDRNRCILQIAEVWDTTYKSERSLGSGMKQKNRIKPKHLSLI